MAWGRVGDLDSLFRPCIFPRAFEKDLFEPSAFFYLRRSKDKQRLNGSLVWQRFAPSERYVHGYGCRLAAKSAQEQVPTVYCGSFEFAASAVRSLVGAPELDEILEADVIHKPESGEFAHADLRIRIKVEGAPSITSTKTAIIDRLWAQCSGPLKHVCADDRIQPHPSAKLESAPLGEYRERRHWLLKMWFTIRFRICEAIWKAFEKK